MRQIKLSNEYVEVSYYGVKIKVPKELAEAMNLLKNGKIKGFYVDWGKKILFLME